MISSRNDRASLQSFHSASDLRHWIVLFCFSLLREIPGLRAAITYIEVRVPEPEFIR